MSVFSLLLGLLVWMSPLHAQTNHPPEGIADYVDLGVFHVGKNSSLNLQRYFTDAEGDSLTFTLAAADQAPKLFSVSPNGELKGTPSLQDTGHFRLPVYATDGHSRTLLMFTGRITPGKTLSRARLELLLKGKPIKVEQTLAEMDCSETTVTALINHPQLKGSRTKLLAVILNQEPCNANLQSEVVKYFLFDAPLKSISPSIVETLLYKAVLQDDAILTKQLLANMSRSKAYWSSAQTDFPHARLYSWEDYAAAATIPGTPALLKQDRLLFDPRSDMVQATLRYLKANGSFEIRLEASAILAP